MTKGRGQGKGSVQGVPVVVYVSQMRRCIIFLGLCVRVCLHPYRYRTCSTYFSPPVWAVDGMKRKRKEKKESKAKGNSAS
jgi:hypothetical protein